MRILLDCDDVLADFRERALQTIADVTGERSSPKRDWALFSHLPPEQYDLVIAQVIAPGWCASLEPCAGAQDAVRQLKEHADVYIVTTAFLGARQWAWERERWLADHFDISWEHIVSTHAKYTVVGDAFVDDKPDHIRRWLAHHPGGRPFMWSPWLEDENSDLEGWRTQDWDQVVAFARGA